MRKYLLVYSRNSVWYHFLFYHLFQLFSLADSRIFVLLVGLSWKETKENELKLYSGFSQNEQFSFFPVCLSLVRIVFSRFFYFRGNLGNVQEKPSTLTEQVQVFWSIACWLFHDEGLYHTETTLLICRTNKWTGFYMIGTSSIRVKC